MELRKLIGLVLIGCVAVWFYRAYEPEITEKLDGVQRAEVDPFLKAEGLYHTFKYDEAVEMYRVALSRGLAEPRQQEAYFRIAAALDKAHRKREALAAYQEAVRRYPNSEDAARSQSALERLRLDTGQ
jgi:tetratricopeptide (TPR) repeat protein